MCSYENYYNAINKIEDNLRVDLIGPVDKDEVLYNDIPINYYCLGILWPKKIKRENSTEQLLNTNEPVEEVEDYLEVTNDSIKETNEYKPSAMGISCMIDKDTKNIIVNFTYGKYEYSLLNDEKGVFKRYSNNLNLNFVIDEYIGNIKPNENRILEDLNLEILCHVRKIFSDKSKLLTISVINKTYSKQAIIDQCVNSFFQCELEVINTNGFRPIYKNDVNVKDIEVLTNEMLYKDVHNYAYGHGCSTKYEEVDNKVNIIKSEFIPSQVIYQMMPNTIENDNFLKMVYWRNIDTKTGCDRLEELINEYKNWLSNRKKENEIKRNYKDAYNNTIVNIETCINRLQAGILTLRNNKKAWESFILMNESMLLQRVKSKRCKEEDVKWYPFQIAYILQIIPDVVDKKSKFRDVVDLLWFPTGGGKTEAYLGVCAFTIFYRRLNSNDGGDGVTIIMRYTLRLLTIQQFERATALICACEYLRRKKNIPGKEINIGLWIGSNMTPNSVKEAEEKIKQIKENPKSKITEGNPQQLEKCPWCGENIDIGCYTIDTGMKIVCKNNSRCDFNKGLPIYLIDEDIYEKQPTLILSTVDKFARIVWEERAKKIFGGDTLLPPELIVQDELHLISGPLGSITGIYEIAIDKLCNINGIKAKVIASTATVRNAKSQIKNLYNRDYFQFPPNGTSVDDSFFSIKASLKERPARRYLGLCQQGGTIADLLIRVYANLIFTKNLFIKQGLEDDVIDQFYTLVGYFNAIKDLGASSSIINDRVSISIKSLINYKFKKESERYGLTSKDIKNYEKNDELTSRKSSKEIKDTLEQLKSNYKSDLCYSYILASNMLSVGIDIDRLGVMTVYNQPKSNAEYIQATSRVGRSNPGVVMTLYNTMRSRDKSHYEQFCYYHKTFYKYVEATSVTPYSARAIEKALHCIYIALVRQTVDNMNKNEEASNFNIRNKDIINIRNYILNRVRDINQVSLELAEESLDNIIREWDYIVENSGDSLVYSRFDGGLCLLTPAERESNNNLPTILNALRNVDPSSNIYICKREDN